MQPTRVGHPARASGAARVQDQPPPAHQDKLLQQRRDIDDMLTGLEEVQSLCETAIAESESDRNQV